MTNQSNNVSFESLENRQLYSGVSLPVDLSNLLGQTIGTASSQPALAASGLNRVVATTQQGVGLLDGSEVYVQRLDSAGKAIGSAIHVNQASFGDQTDPKVALALDGSFVVSYLSNGAAYIRQFAANGTPTGAEQKVSGLLDAVTDTNIANGTDGKFLVTYVTNNLVTGKDIYSKLFNADGTVASPAALLNTNQLGDQLSPTVAALPGGQYVTAFASNLGNSQGFDIVMQRISSTGAALGINTIVNTVTAGAQTSPSVAFNSALNEIGLVYQSATGSDAGDIALQLFNTDGTVKSPSQIVNTVTTGLQKNPMLGVTNAGTFVTSYVTDLSGNLSGTLTTLDGNGLNLGDSALGQIGSGTANIPVVGGATSSLLTAITGIGSQSTVSTQEISIKPLNILGTSANDTVIVLPGVGKLLITMNGVTVNPLLGDFTELSISTGLGNDSVTVANLLNLLGNIAINVNGGAGNDTINSGDTNDTLLGDLGDDLITAGAGLDIVTGGDGNDILNGGDGNDTINGGSGNDSIKGDAGNDILSDIVGSDSIFGGDGIDTVTFASATGKLRIALSGLAQSGLVGQLTTLGTDLENVIGGAGSDTIIGNSLANLLYGGAGNDTIDGGLGSDLLDGGNGVDTVSYASRVTPLSLVLDGSAASGAVGELDTIASSVENAIGGAADDFIIGNSAANLLRGGGGNDILSGFAGNDSLIGESGNDSIDGGDGRDLLAGLAGNDTIEGGHASDLIYGDDGDDNITAGPGADTINAGAGNDRVKAGSGLDWISGDAGNDTLYGDTGNDQLFGADGDDMLIGGTGNDSLEAGSGTDRLYGQTGIDSLVAGSGIDRLDGGASRDYAYGVKDQDTVISAQVLN